MLLLQYFGFDQDPFGVTPDPRCLYESSTHCEALASLKYAFLSSRGFIALIAPPGLGKTTLLLRFLADIRSTARTVFLFDVDPTCEPGVLISYILRDLGLVPGKDSAEMHHQLSEVVAAEALAGRSFVVVVDEAQNLSDTSLEVIRMLTNFETGRSKLVQVVLSGQPLLAERLNGPSLEQLRQRISVFCKLDALSPEQCKLYIKHRLTFAGYKARTLFTEEALEQLIRASEGVPRILNTLCFSALSLCCALKQKQVTAAMVDEVIQDRRLIPAKATATESPADVPGGDSREHRTKVSARWTISAALALVLLSVCAIGVSTYRDRSKPDRDPQTERQEPAASRQRVRQVEGTKTSPVPEAVIVKRNESLSMLAIQRFGVFDEGHLQQIRQLNPELTDVNKILEGQTIVLPPR